MNANPCLAPDAGFAAALREARIPYEHAILELVAAAASAPEQHRSTPADTGNAERGPEVPALPPRLCACALNPPPDSPPRLCASALNPPPAFAFRESLAAGDPRRIRALVSATGFFHADEVAVAEEQVTERLRLGEASGYLFLLAEDAAGRLAGSTPRP